MNRIVILSSSAALVLLSALAIQAQQEPRRPAAPVLTNEDVLSPRAAHSPAEESIRTNNSVSPLRNPRSVLEGALMKISEVNSLRIRMRASLPEGPREIVIEQMKPDRAHIISPEGEMIVIGRKFYMKSSQGWQMTSMPAGNAQSDAGLDFRTFVKEMIGKSGVRITGQVLGSQLIDGVDTVAYEFAISDANETGTIHISVGKDDGYLRRMSVSGGAIGISIWFTDINEQFSIEPPI